MLDFLKKSHPCYGGVFFRGALPPRPEGFAGLRQSGPTVGRIKQKEDMRWALVLEHPQRGKALLYCPRDTSPIPPGMLQWILGITPAERERIRTAGCQLLLRRPAA